MMDLRSWTRSLQRRLDLFDVCFELAVRGLPDSVPCVILAHERRIVFAGPEDVERLEREICDLFFGRFLTIVDECLGKLGAPDWRGGPELMRSLGNLGFGLVLPGEDLRRWSELCAMRNAARDGPRDLWMLRTQIRSWVGLFRRMGDEITRRVESPTRPL